MSTPADDLGAATPAGEKLLTPATWLLIGTMGALALAAVISVAIGKAYLLTPLTRVVIFAIAAVSLNLVLGLGGMVSFGHALYLGIGVYAVGILDHFGVSNGWLHLGTAIGVSTLVAVVVGALSLRVSGVYFIMITLAFTQMAFYFFTGLTMFGGDEGMSLSGRSQFLHALPLKNSVTFYFLCLGVLALHVAIIYRLVHSRFGLVIQGARINERRMSALGYPVYTYRLVAYVISGALCSVSGVLLANLNEFASSQYMHWIISGDLIIMIVMGGIHSVAGPIIGASVFIALQEVLSSYTERWQVVLGPILVLLVIFARDGIVGLFARMGRRRG